MAVPFTDESSLRWILIAFEFFIGLALVYNSKNQPFPRPSARFGWLVIVLASLVLIGQAAPKPMTVFAHFVMLSGIGGFGLVAGRLPTRANSTGRFGCTLFRNDVLCWSCWSHGFDVGRPLNS